MDKQLKHRINAGVAAVKKQTELFHNLFAKVPSEWKEDDTRVTFADFAISEKIFAELRADFPQDDYCSEESHQPDETLELNRRYSWVLDPIDGTNNYALGLPVCAISLALLQDGWPVYGVVYDLSRRSLMRGGPGMQLYDGAAKAAVKTPPLDDQSLIGLSFPLEEKDCAALRPVLTKYRVRSMGSAALHLAYTATGILDGVFGHNLKVWDIAAAHALLQAGGGECRFLGQPVFPLKKFSLRLPAVRYYAGTPSFCALAAGCFTH